MEKKVSVFGSNTVFLIGILLVFFADITSIFEFEFLKRIDYFFYSSTIEFLLVVIVLGYLLINKADIKKTLRLNKLGGLNFLIVIGITICAIPVTGAINFFYNYLISISGGVPLAMPMLQINNIKELIFGIIAVGFSAAVAEEIFSRGLVMRGYESFGPGKMIFMSSLVFTVMHRNIMTLPSIMLLALLLGLVVYWTNSLYAGMTLHFINNSNAVILTFLISKLRDVFDIGTDVDIEGMESLLESVTPIYLVVGLGIFIVAGGALIALMYALRYNNKEKIEASKNDIKVEKTSKLAFMPFVLAMIPIILVYIAQIDKIYSIEIGGFLEFFYNWI